MLSINTRDLLSPCSTALGEPRPLDLPLSRLSVDAHSSLKHLEGAALLMHQCPCLNQVLVSLSPTA